MDIRTYSATIINTVSKNHIHRGAIRTPINCQAISIPLANIVGCASEQPITYRDAIGPLVWQTFAQHRPRDTRQFVRDGHDDDIRRHASGQPRSELLADRRVALTERVHRRSSTMNEQGSQICIAALG
jgi:hypothetical protein